MRIRTAVFGLVAAAAALGLARDVAAGDDAARIADLVDELRDSDPHVREVARKELVALGDRAVPPLVKIVEGDVSRGRDEAVAVLAAMGPAAHDAAPAIAERVKNEKGAARLPLLRALAEIDPVGWSDTAVPVLLGFLEDRSLSVRVDAAKALRSFGPAASKFAGDVLDHVPSADPPVRAALIEAVRAMGVNAAGIVLDLYAKNGDGARAWLPAVVTELGESIVPVAVQRLASDDKNVRASAAQALGAVGASARGAVPQLIAALRDPAGIVRRRAAEALGAVGADPKTAMQPLVDLLADESARAQVEAATAIGRVAVYAAHPGEETAPFTTTVGRAIDDGLDWLARHQNPGESEIWSAAGFHERCPKDSVCGGAGEASNDLGVTALATLAFLGGGETPQVGAHHSNVQHALHHLRAVQDADGCFGPRTPQHWVYQHATSTLAMTEAYRITQSHALKESAGKGVQFILKAQNPYLAWRYAYPPDGDNDTSVTGWMVRALASGRRAGLDVEPGSLRNALAWIEKMTEPEFGRTGYQQRGGPPARTNEVMRQFPAEKSESLTAEALGVRLDAGQDAKSDPMIKLGAQLLAQTPPKWDAAGSIDLCYWFHGTDAMRRIGGPAWDGWRNALVAALVPHQERSSSGCARGSWNPDDPWGPTAGRVYSTSMAVLSLEFCGTTERKAGRTPEVQSAIAALTKALEGSDEAVRAAAQAALDDVKSAYK